MLPILPYPLVLNPRVGEHLLLPSTCIVVQGEAATVAGVLATRLRHVTGYSFEIVSEPPLQPSIRTIHFTLDEKKHLLGLEGYRLAIDSLRVRIEAATPAGLFYGIQTMLQLLPPAIFGKGPRVDIAWKLPNLEIEDRPAFPWRGAMLDCARYFRPVSDIKRFLDLMALHKLNRFHWHLTDDQGWRLEVKKYPRLAKVGSRRNGSPAGHRDAHYGEDGITHEGYYTQTEVRELLDYATERFITIVPEIEMPGHAQAAIAAYPELGCTGKPVEVSTQWGVHETIFNPSDSTLAFLKDVLAEVTALFPGTFVHVGGDEAVKQQWESSEAIQRRMKEIGVPDARRMQARFLREIGCFLSERGRRLIGWDEILEGGDLVSGAAVMAWRGASHALRAAEAGHDTVIALKEYTYLDFYQTPEVSCEPVSYNDILPLEKAYSLFPFPEGLDPAKRRHILGVQGQLWGEYIPSWDELEYKAFPRLTALAEVAWSSLENRDYVSFHRRLQTHFRRLDLLGVRYRPADPIPNPHDLR